MKDGWWYDWTDIVVPTLYQMSYNDGLRYFILSRCRENEKYFLMNFLDLIQKKLDIIKIE